MKLPAQDIPHELVRLAVDFRTWRLAEGAQAARLVDINDRISELGEDEKYTADVVAKFGALDADQAIRSRNDHRQSARRASGDQIRQFGVAGRGVGH